MRAACIVLSAAALAPVGCSMLIAGSGQRLSELATRAEVHEAFGTPPASPEPGVDEYRSRRKVEEWDRGPGQSGIYWVMGGWLFEPYLLSRELYFNARRVAVGQTVRFTYDADGNVKSISLNGKEQPSVGHVPRP
jgi:hypothetical protein